MVEPTHLKKYANVKIKDHFPQGSGVNINKYVNCHHLGFISLDSLLTVVCGGEESPVPGPQSAGVARLAWGSGGMSW